MIKVTFVTNQPRVTDIVDENKTVRKLLEEHNITFNGASIAVDGFTITLRDLDTALREVLGPNADKCTISVLANKDNAASATIAGSACVIKSTLTPEEIKQLKKLHPEALVMKDEDGEPVFAIDIDDETPGNINSVGAVFGHATSDDGKATITTVLDPTSDDPVNLVYEKLGAALGYLQDMEEQIAEVIPQLAEEEARIRGMIIKL